MTTSSADPDDLDSFVKNSRAANAALETRASALNAAQGDFTSSNAYGGFDATALIRGFALYNQENMRAADRVAAIAAAFRRAGGTGAMRALPDAAIEASLRAGGLAGPRQQITVDGPEAYGMPPTTGYANDPVNTASGNFVHTETDLSFGGLAAALSFTRTYNSRSVEPGAFGPGWSAWTECRLRRRPDGAEYVGPDGQRVLFPRQGDGYGRVPDVRGLVQVVDDRLVLSWFSGATWEFDAAGLPVRVDAGPGTVVEVHHERGRLVGLSHQGGRRVAVLWRDERVVALMSSDGRRVDFEYDVEARGVLTGVSGPERVCRYELTADGRTASVVDADGVLEVSNEYDGDGRVLAQVSSFGRRTQFAYLPGGVTVTDDETGEQGNTWLHDAKGRLIGIVDAHGARQSTSYDAWGNPIVVTTRSGATTVHSYDERCRRTRSVLATGADFKFEYDQHDRVLEVVASTGAVVRYRYEGSERIPSEAVDATGGVTRAVVQGGVLRELVDPDGVRLRIEVDDDGQVLSTTDASGATARLERDASGRVTAAVTPLGRRTEYSYDAAGLLSSRREPSGAVWRYEYSKAGRPTAVVDPLGGRTAVVHGDHGSPEQVVDPLGNSTLRRYDLFGHVVGVSAPDGAKWEFGYDALSRLTTISDPSGGAWLREYDVDGNLVASVDPVGTRRTAVFNGVGLVSQVDDGLTSASFGFDGLGRALAQTRPDGSELSVERDLAGRVVRLTDPEGGTTRYEYTAAGRLRTTTSATGRVESFEYDDCGRLAVRVDAAGGRWSTAYDADGAVVSERTPAGVTTDHVYDRAGRLVRSSRPGLGTVRFEYDQMGRVVETTDRTSGRRRFSYDATGRLVAVVDARGGRTEYRYDAGGRVLAVTDPIGSTTTNTYDELGRLVSRTDPLGRRTGLAYDAAGRIVRRTDPTGTSLLWAYDASGRVSEYGPAGAAPATTLRRDALGRVIGVSEAGSTHELAWTRNGQLLSRSRDGAELRWRYDADGRCTGVRLPDGSKTARSHDAAGRLSAVEHPLTGRAVLDRDADGRLTRVRGVTETMGWTYEAGALVAHEVVGARGREATRLLHDDEGRLTAVERGGRVKRFGYDDAGQLVSVRTDDDEVGYTYDAAGRLISERSDAGEVRYSYDAAAQLVETNRPGGLRTRYGYDAAGRRTSEVSERGSRTYSWDAYGRLEEVADSAQGTTRVRVDALGELARVGDTELMWDTADPMSPLLWMGEEAVVHAGPFTAVANGSWSSSERTARDGERDVWGSPAAAGAPRLGYGGELEFAGLSWLRARAYHPDTRGLLSPDPLPPVPGAAWSGNPYAYAGNDPVGSADPLGLRPVTDAELRAYRDQIGNGKFEQAWDWAGENKNLIIAGALVVGGVAVMATGVGGPVGAAMISGGLVAAGSTAAVQQVTTGQVDWGQVAVAGVVGAGAGVVGFAAGAATAGRIAVTNPLARGAIVGGVENVAGGAANRAAYGQDPLNPAGVATDLLTGGIAGGAGGHLGRGSVVEISPASASSPPAPNGGVGVAGPAAETFYRTMSKEHYEQLLVTGRIPATAETFISPSLEYSYGMDGLTLQFFVAPGTTDALAAIGVRNASKLTEVHFPDLQIGSPGWNRSSAYFKGEGNSINIGLGRGAALETFNDSILTFRETW